METSNGIVGERWKSRMEWQSMYKSGSRNCVDWRNKWEKECKGNREGGRGEGDRGSVRETQFETERASKGACV